MRALIRIAALWRPQTLRLLAGLALSLGALACAIALMSLSAAMLAGGVIAVGLLLPLAGPARVVLRYLERLVTHDATFRALAAIRVWFFRGLAARAAGGLGFRQSGDLLNRLVHDVEALDGLYLRILLPLAASLLLVPAAGFFASRVSGLAAIIVLCAFSIAAIVMPLVAARAAARHGGDLSRTTARLRIAALDALTGLREVRAFGAEPRMRAAITAREADLITAQARLARGTAAANAGALLCGQLAILAVLALAGAAPAAATACVFLLAASFEPLALLPRAGITAATAASAAARVLDIADGTLPVPPPAAPLPVPENPGLRFAGVHFAWAPDQPPVFSGLTLEITPGSRVAILGPSGSGKSSLAALALKIVLPGAGKIFLGGTDMAHFNAADVQRRIAMLGQTTHLFSDTIRANLLLGRPDASERDLWEALDRAAIGKLVRNLPEQLDSWLGEGGANLSGGQGRRIALARTLLAQSPVLILDEPCAGLDAETERAFLTTLFAETTGRTVILIAHRLTGAERLDRIWRLSHGHAVPAAA